MIIIAIIPARIGSKGIPKKNIQTIGKKPLIQYSIESAKKSKVFDKIVNLAELSNKIRSIHSNRIHRLHVVNHFYLDTSHPLHRLLFFLQKFEMILHLQQMQHTYSILNR